MADGRPLAQGPLALALAVSLVLHALLVLALPGVRPSGMAKPPVVTVLAARVEAVPARVPAQPRSPEVLKNTLDPPQAKPIQDPIEAQPRRRIAEKKVEAPQPKREPPPKAEPPPAPPREEALGRGLDLRLPRSARAPERLPPEQLRETLGRLSEEMLYPSEALRRGLEGEVVILVELGDGGRIVDASIATGSGHAVLDDAAVRAVRRLGSLGPSSANKSILLPVRFRIL